MTPRDWNHHLHAHYQPICTADTGHPAGWEALARWQDHETVIGPDHAFAGGADPDITSERMLAFATAVARRIPTGFVSVNLTVSTFYARTTRVHAAGLLQAFGTHPNRLVVELLETQPISLTRAAAAARAWRELGVRVALDDYGTGFCDADLVWAVRPDVVKISRSVLTQDTPRAAAAAVRAAVRLASAVGARTIVEGIETTDDAHLARTNGADLFQGWLFGRPAPSPRHHPAAACATPDP